MAYFLRVIRILRSQEVPVIKKTYEFNWGIFSLLEFLGSNSNEIGSVYKTALDIGSGAGVQTSVMEHASLNVFQLDKYSSDAEFQQDFLECSFEQQFDIIYCSHVIEHQRNVGLFLDKIFDLLSDNGLLLISAPKHPPEQLVEGHLNCFYLPYLIQHLIHAGFDLKAGKILSCGHVENAVIAPKAGNFHMEERSECGFKWTTRHKERSPLKLEICEITNFIWHFENCSVLHASEDRKNVRFRLPENHKHMGIHIDAKRLGFEAEL